MESLTIFMTNYINVFDVDFFFQDVIIQYATYNSAMDLVSNFLVKSIFFSYLISGVHEYRLSSRGVRRNTEEVESRHFQPIPDHRNVNTLNLQPFTKLRLLRPLNVQSDADNGHIHRVQPITGSVGWLLH